ncbi:MAG: hypothetical protein FWG87_06740 [Defluviitaleaceae bacterium]|nr:hypothetical protein [Defluviitaleaceae bacterium]
MGRVNGGTNCRGRIYPSRGTHVRQFVAGKRPLTQSVANSGRINPSPTSVTVFMRSLIWSGTWVG